MATITAPKKSSRRSDTNLVLAQLSELCSSLQPGDSIPSHSALAQKYDASEFSVLRALDELRRNGTIIRRQGASTIVADRATGSAATEGNGQNVIPAKTEKAIGIVGRFAPEIAELLVPYIISRALEHALSANKYVTLNYFDCFQNKSRSFTHTEGVKSLLAQNVDILCVISPDPTQVDEIIMCARRSGTQLLFVTEEELLQPVVQVYIDHRYDGYQAANFYLEAGYREVLFIMLGQHQWAIERLEGVRTAFRHAGLPETAVRVFPAENATEVVWKRTEFKEPLQKWVREEMESGRFKGAIIAANDHLALDILEVVEAHEVAKPREFVILGFDDTPEATRRGLTSFRPPLFDMGREGARLLEQFLRDGEIRGTSLHSRLASQLIKRASTESTGSAG